MLKNILNQVLPLQQQQPLDATSISLETFEILEFHDTPTPPVMLLGVRNRVDSSDTISDMELELEDDWVGVPRDPNNNSLLSKSLSPPPRQINWKEMYQHGDGTDSSTGTINFNQYADDNSEQEEEDLIEAEETPNNLAMSPDVVDKIELGVSPRQRPQQRRRAAKKLNS